MEGEPNGQGPDLEAGVALDDLMEGQPFLGHVGEEPVVLVRRAREVLAVGATCTHYGGPLAEGLVVGDTLRCPWHHACFSLRTGEALGAPALNPVPRWRIEVRDGTVYVRGREEAAPLDALGRGAGGPESVVIVGAGAAGSAAAEMLRRQGYMGPIALVDPDPDAPYDRPNLSKDYLAGDAPKEWIPLRPDGFFAEHAGVEHTGDLRPATSPATRTRTAATRSAWSTGWSRSARGRRRPATSSVTVGRSRIRPSSGRGNGKSRSPTWAMPGNGTRSG